MKRKIIYGLVLIILLFVCTGCSKNSDDEEKFDLDNYIQEAIVIDFSKVKNEVSKNNAKAEDYENKVVALTGNVVGTIYSDYCNIEIYSSKNNLPSIMVMLQTEDLKNLKSQDRITVVGTLKNVISSEPVLENAYILTQEQIEKYFAYELVGEELYQKYYYSEYIYDSNIGKIIQYKVSGDNNGVHKLSYDEKGNLVKDVLEFSIKSYGYETENYTYNEDGTISEKIDENADYDDNDQIEISTVKRTYTYEKDGNGNIIKKIEKSILEDDNEPYVMTYEYKYDNENRVIEEKQVSPYSTYAITYNYDDMGYKTSNYSKRIDKESSGTSGKYIYSVVAKK